MSQLGADHRSARPTRRAVLGGVAAGSLVLLGGEYTVDELIRTMYPHPTLNEAFPEAARAVQGRALNA